MISSKRTGQAFLSAVLCGILTTSGQTNEPERVHTVQEIPVNNSEGLYLGNRPPLAPSPLRKLPIGSIKPKGWLRHQLELEALGMTGRLPAISAWCKFDGNAWADPQGQGHSGWEELPYWLKGYGDLGYVLQNEAIIKEARRWIEAVLASQEADGWFGPRALKTSLKGKPDLWPHMVMLNVLQSYHEYSQDPRILPFMARYFRWQLQVPEADFLAGYWPKMRAGDNLESVYWLYNRTGDRWLLELGQRIHKAAAHWSDGIPDWHGVNIAQGFREPGVYFLQAHDKRLLDAAERNYQSVMGIYGQFPGGGFASDEHCRKGFTDPHQGMETCSWVEFLHSFEMLTKISGNPIWADRCEEIAFNSLPASMTADQKALHYLTGANMVQLDKNNHAPGIENRGPMLSFSPLAVYRCCQHNVSHGWPYYAEELWLATADRGLCASLYSASEVTAKVGDDTPVTITEETDYPFRATVHLKISLGRSARFPLYLRIPRWCQAPEFRINSQAVATKTDPHSYLVMDREWKDGDTVTVRFPMTLGVRTWARNQNAVSVEYGPLTFSLKIGEKSVHYGGTDEWPELEVYPTTAWNYGLVLDGKNPTATLELVRRDGPVPAQPFTPDHALLQIKAKAKRIPGWTLDRNGLAGKLQPSPVRSAEPTETITLIPMGAARLRITTFPVIGSGADAHDWAVLIKPAGVTATASHTFEQDTLDALNDGELPSRSGDGTIPRFTWWDHQGTREWVQYDFAKPRGVSSVEVYWFDDTGTGRCRVPASWSLLYKEGETWKPVESVSPYGLEIDRFNKVTFKPVRTSGLRLEVQLRKGYSGGILEWRVGP
ncbi:MAG TPA: beta-L-arabinofuranosidase domain-containing protein [Gemmataceae bacterium]|nr:beta-L-arabinofuranosidase domain-containing protein [Gemmataceae bacterium]